MSNHDNRTAALREPPKIGHVIAYKRALAEIGRPATHEEVVERLGYDLEGLGKKALLTVVGGWIEWSMRDGKLLLALPSSTA